jgi:hypothetical protein
MSECRQCGVTIEAGNSLCAECASGAPFDSIGRSVADSSAATALTRPREASLGRRYADAYTVARTVVGLANTVKILGIVIGSLVALAGLLSAGQAQSSIGAAAALTGVVTGASIGVSLFVLGVLLAALGQILRATLDTAVNTSPLLTKDEVRAIVTAG